MFHVWAWETLNVRGNFVAQAVVRGPTLENFSHPPTHPGEVMDGLMLAYDARPSRPLRVRIRPNLAVPKRSTRPRLCCDSVLNDLDLLILS